MLGTADLCVARDALTRFAKNLCWLLGACGAARGAYLWSLLAAGSDAAGRALILDSAVYWEMAGTIAQGDWAYGGQVYSLAPLYGYWLAGLRAVFGASETPVLVLQQLLGLGTVYCVVLLTRRVFADSAALVAGGLYGFYGAAALLESKILGASLDTFLSLLGVLLLVHAEAALGKAPTGKRRWPVWWALLGSGLALGLAATARPNALLFIPPLLFWLFWRVKNLVPVRVVFGAVALCVAPVLLRNTLVAGDAVLISGQGGITFYQGNNPRASGSYSKVEGLSGDPAKQAQESQQLAAKELGAAITAEPAALKASQVSEYWLGRGLTYLREHPGEALILIGKKLRYWLGSAELSTEYLLRVERELYPVIGLMPVPFGLILAFAFLGGVGTWAPKQEWKGEDPIRERALAALVLIPIVVNLLTVLAFYFASRYRLAAVPFLCVFAGGWVALFWLRLKRDLPVLLWLGTAAAIAIFSLIPRGDAERLQAASQFFNLAGAQSAEERYAQAISLYQRSLELDPKDWRTRYNLALHHLHLQRPNEARAELLRVLALSPGLEPAKRYLEKLPP
ncbi:MAG: hypothetical protein RJA70_208 [Pseudomonadota bacterium]